MPTARPADELDVFNAEVLLAIAFVRRHPAAFGPVLTSEVAPLASVAGPAADGAKVGLLATRDLLRRGQTLFSVYRAFWDRFDCAVDPVRLRVMVNAPSEVRLPADWHARTIFDPRLGEVLSLPDWAMQDKVDDVTLFSDDGLDEAILARLVRLSHPGSTLTLLRPGDRCDFWFRRCGVRHDFTRLLEQLEAAGRKVEQVYASPTGAPVMLTVFGVS